MANLFFASEILEINITEELNGAAFYAALAQTTKNPQVARVARDICEQEKSHAKRFSELKQILKSEEQPVPGKKPTLEYLSWISEQAVFTTEDAAKQLAAQGTDKETIRFAIKIECATIELLKELKKYIDKKDKVIIELVLDEEESHIKQLDQLLKELV
jgi:rubrerythrin